MFFVLGACSVSGETAQNKSALGAPLQDLEDGAVETQLRELLGDRYRSRSDWGAAAPRSDRPCTVRSSGGRSLEQIRFQRMTVHHTGQIYPGGPNLDPEKEDYGFGSDFVREVQRGHQTGRGFCDISYNYLIVPDEDGTYRVYQGRSLAVFPAGATRHNGASCTEEAKDILERTLGAYNTSTSGCAPSAAEQIRYNLDANPLCGLDTSNVHIAIGGCFQDDDHPHVKSAQDRCPGGPQVFSDEVKKTLAELLGALSYLGNIPLDTVRGHRGLNYNEQPDKCPTQLCDHANIAALQTDAAGVDSVSCEVGTVCPGNRILDMLAEGTAGSILDLAGDFLTTFQNESSAEGPRRPANFDDIDNSRLRRQVAWVHEQVPLAGCGENLFCPNDPLKTSAGAYLLLGMRLGSDHSPEKLAGGEGRTVASLDSETIDWAAQSCTLQEGTGDRTLWGNDCPDASVALTRAQFLRGLYNSVEYEPSFILSTDGEGERELWFQDLVGEANCGEGEAVTRGEAICLIYTLGTIIKRYELDEKWFVPWTPDLSIPATSEDTATSEAGKVPAASVLSSGDAFATAIAGRDPSKDFYFAAVDDPATELSKVPFTAATCYARIDIDPSAHTGSYAFKAPRNSAGAYVALPGIPTVSKAAWCNAALNGTVRLTGTTPVTLTVAIDSSNPSNDQFLLPSDQGVPCNTATDGPAIWTRTDLVNTTQRRTFYQNSNEFGETFAPNHRCGTSADTLDCKEKYRAIPFRTVAISKARLKAPGRSATTGDTHKARVLFIPRLRGYDMGGGKTHDGFVFASDTGSFDALTPERLDFHAGAIPLGGTCTNPLVAISGRRGAAFDAYWVPEGHPKYGEIYEDLWRAATVVAR